MLLKPKLKESKIQVLSLKIKLKESKKLFLELNYPNRKKQIKCPELFHLIRNPLH